MKRACVIGWPIAHSRSPVIHRYWLNKHGLDGRYDKVAVQPDDAVNWLSDLAGHGLVGCNVTVPHKETAYQVAEVRAPSAEAVKAANTLWLEDGKLHAANTDTYGFMAHLEQSVSGWRDRHRSVLILGAGGAARAIAFGFLEAGVDRVNITNRTASRASGLVDALGGKGLDVVPWDQRQQAARSADIIVNTTTLGMASKPDDGLDGLALDFTERQTPDSAIVCDIVYVPLETDLLKAARAAGHTTVDGLGMLLHQAVPGFEKWFGVRPEVTKGLRQAVLDDLAHETN